MPKIGCVQIAGLVARRILCDVDVGDKLAAGQVYGLIRFGSRVDIWLPASIDALVLPGQRTLAGETVLAKLPAMAKKSASPAVVKTAKKPALKAAKKPQKKQQKRLKG